MSDDLVAGLAGGVCGGFLLGIVAGLLVGRAGGVAELDYWKRKVGELQRRLTARAEK